MTGARHSSRPADLLELLAPIPVGCADRLAWLDRLDSIIAGDVANIGDTLAGEGWGTAAAQEAITAFGAFLADRIVAVVAAVADDLARSEQVRP